MNKSSEDVDQYIASAPKELQGKLKQLRAAIKEVSPQSEESISYGMPYYGYKGRLVYFALMKKHIGLYIPPPVIENHQSELKDYQTTKSAIHLSWDEELPIELIKKLIKARIKWNEEKEGKS